MKTDKELYKDVNEIVNDTIKQWDGKRMPFTCEPYKPVIHRYFVVSIEAKYTAKYTIEADSEEEAIRKAEEEVLDPWGVAYSLDWDENDAKLTVERSFIVDRVIEER